MKVITDRGAEKLARMLPHMSDKRVAFLITSLSRTQLSVYIERGIDCEVAKDACQRLDNMVLWALETGMEMADITENEEDFFQEVCQSTNFKPSPYQQAPARLSTGAGGVSSSLGNLISTLAVVFATLSGPLGEAVKDKLPEFILVARMGDAIKELHQDQVWSEEVLKGVIPPSWVTWALDQSGENGRRQPTVSELAAHDGESTTPRKAQRELGKAINKVPLDQFMESPGQLPQEAAPPTPRDPFSSSTYRE